MNFMLVIRAKGYGHDIKVTILTLYVRTYIPLYDIVCLHSVKW